jgi:Ca2+:H+ antiporter
MLSILRREIPFVAGALTTAIFYTFGKAWLDDLSHPAVFGLLFVWVFSVMLWCAFAVVRHADCLAERLGEPYGTLILTIAVIGIEASVIAAIMLTGGEDPALARDTMLAVLIIVLNGMVGLSLLIGGFRYGEQEFNLQGARAYLAVIVTLATMTLIMPRFTISTGDASLTQPQAILFSAITVALYVTFLGIQTVRHRGFFVQPPTAAGEPAEDREGEAHHGLEPRSTGYHAVFLLLTLLPIVLLSKTFATLVDHVTDGLGAPAALGGVLVALLVLSPEGLAAFRAAYANRLQRSVNVCLGSALATIGLTVPTVLIIGLISGQHVVLGLDGTEMVLLILTLFLSSLTFGAKRTNVLNGAVHLVVFVVYFILIFDP